MNKKVESLPENAVLNHALKHLTAITNTASASRPALKLVNFSNGTVKACDSFRALILKSPFGDTVTSSLDLTTFSVNDNVNYPDIDKLKLDKSTSLHVGLDFKISATSMKLINALKTDDYLYLASGNHGELEVRSSDQSIVLATIETDEPEFQIEPIAFSPKYLIDAINAMLDLKDNHVIFIYKANPLSPVNFAVDGFDYIVSPMRPKN